MKKAASSRLQQKSPAEFFAENKNIAGFDNVSAAVLCVQLRLHATIAVPPVAVLPHMFACLQPGKCLYTTVRELVENSLDAAESIGLLPDIDIEM